MKRQRGRGRRPGGGGGGGGHQHGNNPNRALESNGPDTKVRGPASVIYERYLQLARDAASSGDRVLSENYLQHADHYFRLWRSMQPAQPIQPPPQDRFGDGEVEGDEETASEGDRAEGETVAEGEEQPDVEFPQGQQQQGYEQREGGGGRRRRGRRDRFRSGEGEGAEAREGGGEERAERRPRDEGEERRPPRGEGEERRPPRGEGESRRERAPRERDGDRESSGPEGFSNGPKPAFLRSSE